MANVILCFFLSNFTRKKCYLKNTERAKGKGKCICMYVSESA